MVIRYLKIKETVNKEAKKVSEREKSFEGREEFITTIVYRVKSDKDKAYPG